jgi:hypothetical protein
MKIYVLSLIVDQRNGPGSTTESQWISMDKAKIEKKKKTERQKLLGYFGITSYSNIDYKDKDGTPYTLTEDDGCLVFCVKCVSDCCKHHNIEEPNNYINNPELLSLDAWDRFEKFVENRKCDYTHKKDGISYVCGGNHKKLESGWLYTKYPNNIEDTLIREFENKGDICYYDRDLDSFPRLIIKEIEVTKKVKDV